MKKKSINLIVLISMFFISIFTFSNTVKAVTSYELGIVQARENGYAYQISSRDVFKIVTYVSGGYNYDNALYCIKAGPGFGGTITDPLEKRTYSVSYNLKEFSNIPENYKAILPSDTSIKTTIEDVEYSYTPYNAVLWILDNIYLPKSTNATALKNQLLSNAFADAIKNDGLTLNQINLTDEDIEVVQQLAIWHFTNDGDFYDQGESLSAIQLKDTNDGTSVYASYDILSNRQEDAETLYSYFITEAIKNAADYGTGDKRNLKSPLVLQNNTLTTEYTDSSIIVGPFTLKKQTELNYDFTYKVVDENDNEVTNYTILYENDSSERVTLEAGKTIEDILGKKFYILVSKTLNINSITFKGTVKYSENKVTFLMVSGATNTEQPLALIVNDEQTFELTSGLKYNFDLELKKFIVAVNNQSITNRVPTLVISSTGEVDKYNTNKEPVKVESGDLVTYKIRIYNTGKVDGYSSEVKDNIPEGLEFVENNTINVQYGWTKSGDGKYITTSYLTKDQNAQNLLKAFDYPTMSTPDYKDLLVVFKVTEPNSSTRQIKNIAEISADIDANGNEIDDKDSTPNNNALLEDDIDQEYLVLKTFDLALKKFITSVNDTKVTTREPKVSVDESGNITYTLAKEPPISVENGNIVVYTIRVYNEGETAGYAKEIKDNIPSGLEYIVNNEININYRWRLSEDQKTVTTDYLSYEHGERYLLSAFNAGKDSTPDYEDVKIAFKVTEPNTSKNILKNIAEISDDADKNNNATVDKDSTPNNNIETEDDIDYELVRLKYFDLALQKFITAVNDNELTGTRSRVPTFEIDSNGKHVYKSNATEAVPVANGDLVTYTIRIYNEGSIDGYASIVKDDIPEGLEFVTDNKINQEYKWVVSADGKSVTTDYLSKENSTKNLIAAFDNGTMTSPNYKDLKLVFKVTEPATSSRIIVNTAEIAQDADKNGLEVEDVDSTPNNNIATEDDIDTEKVKVVAFDLALKKFITAVNDNAVTSRTPVISIDENGKITYTMQKDNPVLVSNGDLVTYTIRVYNEGTLEGYAEEIKDDIPNGLEFIEDNTINVSYGWKLSSDKKYITTDYLSKTKNADNIINIYNKATMQTLDYEEVKVVFKVTEQNLPQERILINTAEISKDGNDYDTKDIDSTPNNNIATEDDIDTEKVKVQYFDLSLLKWVSKVIITEDGVTTQRETGYTGLESPKPIVKVELDKKKLSVTTVKFEYIIKVTNEGQIAGYAKEVSDYIQEGLKFVASDNTQWTEANGKVTTTALANTLLQPGESASVSIILTWVNDENNLDIKVNIAEISKDYNEVNAKDIDSTPDNKIESEDDQDNASVLLQLKTGQERIYYVLYVCVLVTLIGGVALIKKFVL